MNIPTMIRFRDAAKSRAATPDATHVILSLTVGGEQATFVDQYYVEAGVLFGLYDENVVLALPVDADWAAHAIDAIELVDSATVEANITEKARDIMRRAGLMETPPDDRMPF